MTLRGTAFPPPRALFAEASAVAFSTQERRNTNTICASNEGRATPRHVLRADLGMPHD